MYRNQLIKKILSVLVCFTLVMSYVPTLSLNVTAADPTLNILSGSKKADPSTINWETYFGLSKMDTEFAGGVWTDKSVFTDTTDELPGVTLTDDDNFLVALSSIASNLSITGHTSSPTDTMLVLDVSGSMVNDTYEVGTIYQRNNYTDVKAIDMSLITAMIDATNDTIDTLMKQNTNNRVGVVLYSGNINANDAATSSTATVVLPLGRYSGVNGEYLSVDTTWTTSTLYTWRSNGWFGGSYIESGEATYVAEGTDVDVVVKTGLKTEGGQTVNHNDKQVVGGTYIQNGLYKAMNQFLDVDDTVVPEGKPQAGAERMPVLVLMSDGAPTIATSSYTDIGNSNIGDGRTTNDRITFLTQLTAAYVRGNVTAHYQEDSNDEQDFLFLTLGLGTENSTAATNTLYPAGSSTDLQRYWASYLNTQAGRNVTLSIDNQSLTVERNAAVKAMNYVDKYFYASDAQGLIDSFGQVINEIELKAGSYATLVEGGNADFSGYVTFEDELGELMHVADIKGVLMSDGNGGTVLYTGKGIAESMTNGVLGTVDTPTERGDELVRTVRERIPGVSTTQAQQLIGYAYNDQQLYYVNDNNWSNYIGWYADADGNYAGFWDKDSGYENAPANAAYANRSYGYLGVNGSSDMMHVVVMVRTNLATLHQTVFFKIPASLLPTVQYKITLSEDDPTAVEKFEREDAVPMQLVFEVGLRSDINSINLEQKIAEHIQKGGHVHRNNDGTVTFYTNEWKIGNDTNQNGIPDPEEVETAEVAESHFYPAMDNSRYYYTEDTLVLDADGNPVTGAIRPVGSYFHLRHIYNETERTSITMPIAASTLANDARYDRANDRWYIPAGTMHQEVSRFVTNKTENTTETLYYSDYPAVFKNGTKQDVYAFLGNNGSFTVAPAQGIALNKTIDEPSDDANAPTTFTFDITLSQAVAAPVITDTDGNLLQGIASVDGRTITVTLTAGQTVVISGIPTGTDYTVTEHATEYYSASSANATGTVAANTVHAVDFVNTAMAYGSLLVSKDVNYPQGFVPGMAHNNKTFPITVTFEGDVSAMTAPQGAVQNDNAYTMMLKDGQSATFTHIPAGVTYTVTEGETPAGYALQEFRYSDTDQRIDGKDLDEAHVVNNYTLTPVSPTVIVRGDKTLVTNEDSWQGETFTVELLRINNFADEDPTSTGLTDTMSENDPQYEIDMSSVEFTTAGTYYFRVAEVIPEDRNENIAYDRTFGLFSITVGDADADGALEIQSVNVYQNTNLTSDADGWIVEKDFTNVVTTDRIYLDIQKHITDTETQQPVNAHLGDITFGLFNAMRYDNIAPVYYGLTNTQGEATLMIPVTKEILEQEGISGRLVYFMREIAPAVENRVVGMQYNEDWMYAISIMWDDATNKAIVSYAPIENDAVGGYTPYENGNFVFEHTNLYDSTVSVDIDLTGYKTLNGGNDLGDREFTFGLYDATAAFVKGQKRQIATNDGNAISFQDVTFNAPGVYYLVAKEEASALGGVTDDPTEYHITVTVEKFTDTDGITRLRVVDGYPTVVRYGTSTDVGANGLNFNNLYTVTGQDEITIRGKKVLDGRLLVADEFSIGLYSDAACENAIETVTNRADGTFAFSPLTFTAAHLGENFTEKTYIYYVKEIVGDKGGVSYDPNVYTVTVNVDHKDGNLIVTASDNVASLQINNTYTAQPVDVTINGHKSLSGDWSSVTDKEFTFELFEADAQFALVNDDAIATAVANGDTDFSITLHYEDGEEGFHYYVLKEDTSAQAGGISYDAGEYHITINVTDTGDGQLNALTTIYRPGSGNTNTTVFTNTYTVEPTSVTLEGTKIYTNSVTGATMPMTDGMFNFAVLEGADADNVTLAATGYNLADGTIEFTPIRYTAAGTHTYRVVEISGEAGGVTYDTETVFTVTVTVTDNGDGTLSTAVDYHNTPVTFNNTYTHQAARVTFDGIKTLDGDWTFVAEQDKIFTFELYETDATFAVGATAAKQTVNDSDGNFSFGAMTYTTAGTHYYVIRERAAAVDNGITYDGTEYHITVVVTDDGNGNLIPNVTAQEDTVTITSDATNNREITVAGLAFANAYHAKPATFTPEVVKQYEGDEMKEFDFVLTVNGQQKQRKQNTGEGAVLFDTLTFEAVGEYELTIREQENVLWGFIRWDRNVYTVTLHVEDDGKGQLFVNDEKTVITSEKGREDLIFHNVHKDLITEKDVFAVNEPTISIDGETVLKGDILLYTVSYTNFDSVPTDITITDAIPEYTTYVEGSADNGGVYDNGVLTWMIEGVAPDATVTVRFQVTVDASDIIVTNTATVLEGENEYRTNEVINPVPKEEEPPTTTTTTTTAAPTTTTTTAAPTTTPTTTPQHPDSPKTGENMTMLWLWITLLFVSGGLIAGTATKKSHSFEE